MISICDGEDGVWEGVRDAEFPLLSTGIWDNVGVEDHGVIQGGFVGLAFSLWVALLC